MQQQQKGLGFGVAEAHRTAVAIGEMNVSDAAEVFCDRLFQRYLLDVHVEEVSKQRDICQLMLFQKRCGIADSVEKVRLVAVERFVNELNPVRRGTGRDDMQSLG